MTKQAEFQGMPEPSVVKPRKGSVAWVKLEWKRFVELAAEHGGLTSPSMAAVALNRSKARVHQLLDEGKLRSFEVMGKRFVACDDIEEFAKLERDTAFRYDGVAA